MSAQLQIVVVFLLVFGCCDAQARTWTNDQGKQIEAELVRVSGNTAILNKGGEAIRAPIDQLCQADQDYLNAYKEVRKFREWTIKGQPQRARYVEYRDGEVVLKLGYDNESFSLDDLSAADRKLIEDLESLSSVAAPPRFGGAGGNAGPQAGDMRTWTNSAGKAIEAEFRRVEGDEVVLYFRDREWNFPLNDLSQADRDYVNGTGQAPMASQPDFGGLAGGSPAGGDFGRGNFAQATFAGGGNAASVDSAMGDIRGRMGMGGMSPPGSDFAAQARARHEQAIAEARARHEQSMAEMNARSESVAAASPRFGGPSSEPEVDQMAATPSSQFSAPRMAEPSVPSVPEPRGFQPRMSEPANDFASPRPSIPTPPAPRSSVPSDADFEYVECGQCGHLHNAASFKAGQKCKGCGVRIDVVHDERGNIVDQSPAGRSYNYTRIARGIIGIVVLGAGLLGWIGRKMGG